MDGIAKGRHGKKPKPVHHTDGLNLDFGAVCGGLELFELGASSGAVDGPKGGGYADATGAMQEGARNLAHQAKIREAQEYLRQQNAQKQQQRLGLAYPPQLQYQPPPPPPPLPPPPPPPYLREQNAQKEEERIALPHPPQPQYQPPPPPPAPAPLQSVSSPKKRGFAEIAKGDSRDCALPASVQQAPLYVTEAGQEPPGESVTLQADGGRCALSAAADSCVSEEKSGQKTLPTPRRATPSVTALSVLDAPGAKGVARVEQSECVGICGGTHIYMHARTRTL